MAEKLTILNIEQIAAMNQLAEKIRNLGVLSEEEAKNVAATEIPLYQSAAETLGNPNLFDALLGLINENFS